MHVCVGCASVNSGKMIQGSRLQPRPSHVMDCSSCAHDAANTAILQIPPAYSTYMSPKGFKGYAKHRLQLNTEVFAKNYVKHITHFEGFWRVARTYRLPK